MKRTFLLICLLCSLSALSCGKMTGQFAYKLPEMDAYRHYVAF
ncbi:MAG: hypothetical protein ACRCUT_14785 [Spirochaetota bacterium]